MMLLLSGIVVFIVAILISAIAAFFSIVGLGALFAAAYWPVVIMGSALEVGKLVAASWLHANWHNPKVNVLHKSYLTVAVATLMLITAIGIYGYLAKGHLEQEAPLATLELQIRQIEQRIEQTEAERDRLNGRLTVMDQAINAVIATSRSNRDATAANRIRDGQKREREQVQTEILAKNAELNRLTADLVPLRMQSNDVTAKLGPLKYVASLFGFSDPAVAVQIIIVMIMLAFDPLAVMLIISGTITLRQWSERQNKGDVIGPAAAPATAQKPSDAPSDAPSGPFVVPAAAPAVVPARADQSVRYTLQEPPFTYDKMTTNAVITSSIPVPDLPTDREKFIDILERHPDYVTEILEAAGDPDEGTAEIDYAESSPSGPKGKYWLGRPWILPEAEGRKDTK